MQHTRIFFIYICIFATVVSKTGYSKYEIGIYIFYNINKKNSDFKINIPENKLFLFLLFFPKKKVSPARSLAQTSDPAGHKKRGRSYSSNKVDEYCSSELIHLNSANSKNRKMHAAR